MVTKTRGDCGFLWESEKPVLTMGFGHANNKDPFWRTGAPTWKIVGRLSKERLHGLYTTFYADSESVIHSKVKKCT